MRKTLRIWGITLALTLIAATMLPATAVLATGNSGQAGGSNVVHLCCSNIGHLDLYEKIPQSTPGPWQIVPSGAWGKMNYNLAGQKFNFLFSGHKLASRTAYTLIYYGDATHNDVYPYATIIASGTTNKNGNLYLAGSYNFGFGLTNGKIWLVLSSDVTAGSMTKWNPTEYLFEGKLINYDDTNN